MRSPILLLLAAGALAAAPPPRSIHAKVREAVDYVSRQRIEETLRKLEGFGTRNTMSVADHPTRGIGAARRWIYEEMKSYSPRLQVRYDSYRVKQQGRIFRDVELVNVVAELPGTRHPEKRIVVNGHYDSLNIVLKEGAAPEGEAREWDHERTAAADAPGVTDDGSGTAATMELARILSQYEFDHTLVFIAFAGEEQGLIGSSLYAQKSKEAKEQIEAVLTNDIIGSDTAGDGSVHNRAVRIFSEDPNDSPSRQVALYLKEMAGRYVPAFSVETVFRSDRFGRGGDHTPFNAEGFAAVRITSAAENYTHQHTATDTFANTSPGYITAVTRINAAALATLALAPCAPVVTREIKMGPRKGQLTPNLGRGRGSYDAVLRWKPAGNETDLAGYAVVIRKTTASAWERELWVGNVTEYTIPGLSIDEITLGVKAVDTDGNESLVSVYQHKSFPREKIEIF